MAPAILNFSFNLVLILIIISYWSIYEWEYNVGDWGLELFQRDELLTLIVFGGIKLDGGECVRHNNFFEGWEL